MSDFGLASIKSFFEHSENFCQTIKLIESGKSVIWNGCRGSGYALLGGILKETTEKTILMIVPKVGVVERAVSDLSLFTDVPIYNYPLLTTNTLHGREMDDLSENTEFGSRLRVLKALDRNAKLKNVNEITSPIIVSTVEALVQPVPSREQIEEDSITLHLYEEFGRDHLLDWLAQGGGFHFSKNAVEFPGEYSFRGGIVDVYAIDWNKPIRIEFFGDEVESIRTFDIVDQRSCETLNSIEISRLRASGEASGKFVERLPNDSIVFMYETNAYVFESSTAVACRETRLGKKSPNIFQLLINELSCYPILYVGDIVSRVGNVQMVIDADFTTVERLQGNLACIENAFNEIKDNVELGIICASEPEKLRLTEMFAGTKPAQNGRIFYVIGTLADGFESHEGKFILIGSDQLFGRSIARRTKFSNSKKLSRTIDSFLELNTNDYVVHVDRGIAQYKGMIALQKTNQREDQLILEFAGGSILYVPASQIGKVQRYIGVGSKPPVLSNLNSSKWDRQKKEARAAVWELAEDMVRLQAERDLLEGFAFPEDSPEQKVFESSFPYQETDDQLKAVDEIKKDMERSRPMDRLLCGDVGFGKTEVAIRAAYKAVEAGRQVAVLVPTTVLAEQHYRTFCDRFANWAITVDTLSRYSTKKEQAETIRKIKEGNVDVVIGTHRIVQNDVQFKDLGLVIIDEEQKFGVKDKERLKRFRELVDVLTMTATPIPRTLHFSLLGIRDISNLTTPPADRLPVETKVVKFNDELIRFAFLRELNRGGQIYFLHNRVYDIENLANKLRYIVPEARIRVGHAQMSNFELEETMRDFVLKKFDVLVCTTIVESGLDISNANTIFINNADRFGMAELHQLRGRVGREKKQAYCYLLLEANQTLNEKCKKRLNALTEYSKLGSGYQIAMKDLEIRGAGNILGTEQSGHIAIVGYEMYCDFLSAAVNALKHMPLPIRIDTEIDLPGCGSLPDEYIPIQKDKIDFYRRFNRVTKFQEALELRNELQDRFGKLPPEAEYLFVLAQIRLVAFDYRVKSIKMKQVDGMITYKKMLEISFLSPDLMYKLQGDLKKRGIVLHLTESRYKGVMEGYVGLPDSIFEPNGCVRVETLLDFTFNLFCHPKDEGKGKINSFNSLQGRKRGRVCKCKFDN